MPEMTLQDVDAQATQQNVEQDTMLPDRDTVPADNRQPDDTDSVPEGVQGDGEGEQQQEQEASVDWKKRYSDLSRKITNYEKELESVKSKQMGAPQAPQRPATVEEMYLQNPVGVRNQIGQEIYRREHAYNQLDMFDPEHVERGRQLRNEIVTLQQQERYLENVGQQVTQEQYLMSQVNNGITNEILKEIPDYRDNYKNILDFVQKDLKFSPETLQVFQNPSILLRGLSALGDPMAAQNTVKAIKEMVVAVNKMYATSKGRVFKEREVRNPMHVESAGSGSKPSTGGANLKALADKAQKSGNMDDWVEYSRQSTEANLKKLRR